MFPYISGLTLEVVNNSYLKAEQCIPELVMWHLVFRFSHGLAFPHHGIGADWRVDDQFNEAHIPITHGDIHWKNIVLLPPEPGHQGRFREALSRSYEGDVQ